MYENLELELTNELLTVSNEQELNQFIGGLVQRVAGAASNLAQSPKGKQVGRFLVNFGRNTLPQVAANLGGHAGSAIGDRAGKAFGDGIMGQTIKGGLKDGGTALGKMGGTWAGQKAGNWLASTAQRVFNLELAELSAADREYEIARSFVRFANDVVKRANTVVRTNPTISLTNLAKQVITPAARNYAPGLLPRNNSNSNGSISRYNRQQGGTWVRRGQAIILNEYY